MINAILNRPLSKGMNDTLMEVHEREILGQDLCGQETRHIAGLFKRGMVDLKLSVSKRGKPYMGFCITESGKIYLEKLVKTPEWWPGLPGQQSIIQYR